jgi:hypothetical protein
VTEARSIGDTCPIDEGGEGGSFPERSLRVVDVVVTKGEDNLFLKPESDNEGEADLWALSDPPDGIRTWDVVGIDPALVARVMVDDTARREGEGGEVETRGEVGRFREFLGEVLGDPAPLGAAEYDPDVA